MTVMVVVLDQAGFRIRNDTTSPTSSGTPSWVTTENQTTSYVVDTDTMFRVRFAVHNDGSANFNEKFVLYYDSDTGSGYSGTYSAVSTTTPIEPTDVSGLASPIDLTASTDDLLTSGAGTSANGAYVEAALVERTGAANLVIKDDPEHCEVEIALQLDSAQVSGGDKFKLRLYNNNGGSPAAFTGTYDYEPEIEAAATAKTSSGGPSIAEVTASGSAKLIIESSGSPSIDTVTASGSAGRVLDSSGSPSIDAVEASGIAENVKAGSGNPSIDTVTASGAATKISLRASSGSPNLDEITASGVAENVKAASGSPSIDVITASGTAAQTYSATGSPSIDAVTASGTAENVKAASGSPSTDAATSSGSAGKVLDASGSPSTAAVTASGAAAQELSATGSPSIASPTAAGKAKYYVKKWLSPTGLPTAEYGAFTKALAAKSGSGSPSIDAVTASGVAENVKTASGSPNTDEITASGTASKDLTAAGSPSIDAVTASGIAGRVLAATGSPTLDDVDAAGAAAQELSASGSPSTDTVTASGTGNVFGNKPASGSPSVDEVTASGVAAQTYSASGSPSIDAVTASGTATKDLGVQTQRNMGPHGLVSSYPDVLREYGVTVTVNGAAISADGGNVTESLPVDAIQLGPHGLVTYDRQFSSKGIGPATANVTGAQIDLEFAYPDSADATIYPDGEDADATAGSVSEAEAQISGAGIQALAGVCASAVNISPTPSGAQIQALTSDSAGVPGTGAAIDGASIVAQAATPSDIHYDFAVTGMSGAEIVGYHAEIGHDTNFDVGALIYGRELSSGFGAVTQETSESEKQQGSWGGGGGKGRRRKKFKKRKFHMPLAGVKLRDRPFENPVIEEEIEQIVDEVIEAAEELEAKGYAEAISADIIAEMARLKAATDEALIRGIRNTEAVSRRLAEAKLGARINELVRRRRAYIRVEHERILRDQLERARQQELERKRQREYEIRKARAEWRAELLLNQPIEPYEEPTIDDEADVEAIMQLMEEIL